MNHVTKNADYDKKVLEDEARYQLSILIEYVTGNLGEICSWWEMIPEDKCNIRHSCILHKSFKDLQDSIKTHEVQVYEEIINVFQAIFYSDRKCSYKNTNFDGHEIWVDPPKPARKLRENPNDFSIRGRLEHMVIYTFNFLEEVSNKACQDINVEEATNYLKKYDDEQDKCASDVVLDYQKKIAELKLKTGVITELRKLNGALKRIEHLLCVMLNREIIIIANNFCVMKVFVAIVTIAVFIILYRVPFLPFYFAFFLQVIFLLVYDKYLGKGGKIKEKLWSLKVIADYIEDLKKPKYLRYKKNWKRKKMN